MVILRSILKRVVSKSLLHLWLSVPCLRAFCNENPALPSLRWKKSLVSRFAAALKGKKRLWGQVCAWKAPHPATEGGCSLGSCGDWTCQPGSRVVAGCSPGSRKQEHPHPGASGGEQRHGSPQKEPEPRGVGSCPSAFGLDAAFASKKGFKEFGLP